MSEELTEARWLLAVASSPGPGPKMVDFATLVQRGLAEVEDIAELRAAGLTFFEYPDLPEDAPRVWIDARAFIRAAAVVAERRNRDEAFGGN